MKKQRANSKVVVIGPDTRVVVECDEFSTKKLQERIEAAINPATYKRIWFQKYNAGEFNQKPSA